MAASPITPLGWVAIGGVGLLILRGLRRRRTGSSARATARGPVSVIGDSLAVGLAGPLKSELAELGQVTGWGVGGSIAAMWTMQVDAVLATRPGTVIVSLGTNDALSPDARAKFAGRIKTIVDKVRAAGALPVVLKPPKPLPADMSAAIDATGAVVIASPGVQTADGIHPTGAGYQQWAKQIAGVIA